MLRKSKYEIYRRVHGREGDNTLLGTGLLLLYD